MQQFMVSLGGATNTRILLVAISERIKGRRDRTEVKAFAWQAADPGSTPGTKYGSPEYRQE